MNPVPEDNDEIDDQGDVNDDDQGENEANDQATSTTTTRARTRATTIRVRTRAHDQGDVNDDDQGENEGNDDQQARTTTTAGRGPRRRRPGRQLRPRQRELGSRQFETPATDSLALRSSLTTAAVPSVRPPLVRRLRPRRLGTRDAGSSLGTASWTDPTPVKDGHFYPPEAKTRRGSPAASTPRSSRSSRSTRPTTSPPSREELRPVDRADAEGLHVQHQGVLAAHQPPDASASRSTRTCSRSCRRISATRRTSTASTSRNAGRGARSGSGSATRLMPLHSAGKLGAVLFQFPQWFVIGRKNKDYILECAERLKDFRLAIEFRHKTLDGGAQRRGDALVPGGARPAAASASTCRRASTRASRRSPRRPRRTLGDGPASTAATARCGSEERTRALGALPLRATRARSSRSGSRRSEASPDQARETHVLMNNCYRDFAVNNARQLADLLEE